MTIVPIELPQGMMRNGTPYAARGRYVDGNLVRWHNKSLRPIGGWEQAQNPTTNALVSLPLSAGEVARDGIRYRNNAGVKERLIFSNNSVYRINESNVVIEVTPATFPSGNSVPTYNSGYGVGPYGEFTYGTPRPLAGQVLEPVDRVVSDMWGENVLYAMINTGSIFQHLPGTVPATVLANAPTNVADLIVTDERIVMVITNDGEIRQVIWSDREDNDDWTATQTNYAGSYRLPGTGNLVGLYKVLKQILILSETDAHVGRFVGAPFVYRFDRVGNKCAPLANKAVAVTDRFAMWPGRRQFWMYDGTLRPVTCDVMDFLAKDMNFDAVSKIHNVIITQYGEIWWYYQSTSSPNGDIDSYVAFDYIEQHWQTGRLSRTYAEDAAFGDPVFKAGLNGALFDHELDSVKPDGEMFALTGPLELENGQRNMAVRYVFPDTEAPDEVELEFYTRQMPTDPDVMHGPFAYRNPISTTGVLGREVRMRVKGLTNNWEVGTMRFDVQAVGGGFR